MKVKNSFSESIPNVEGNIEHIEKVLNKSLQYASMGRFGIYHILKAFTDEKTYGKTVMMPVYACESIAWAIKKAGYSPIYYDICPEDFNGSLECIQKIARESGSKILLLPSLYGNPADLVNAEKFCRKEGIFLIDDAAQAFGASLEGKMIGTFGDGGLFSFSAGKPTFGHMGCFFWTRNEYTIKRTKHYLYHKIAYVNFFYNRYGDYNAKKLYRCKLVNYFLILLFKLQDISNDGIFKYEESILANIAEGNLSNLKRLRDDVMECAQNVLRDSKFRLVETVRGDANNNKLVLVADTKDLAEELISFMKKCNLYCAHGYHLLDDASVRYPVASSLYKRVVEIPIVVQEERNKRTLEALKNFIETRC